MLRGCCDECGVLLQTSLFVLQISSAHTPVSEDAVLQSPDVRSQSRQLVPRVREFRAVLSCARPGAQYHGEDCQTLAGWADSIDRDRCLSAVSNN